MLFPMLGGYAAQRRSDKILKCRCKLARIEIVLRGKHRSMTRWAVSIWSRTLWARSTTICSSFTTSTILRWRIFHTRSGVIGAHQVRLGLEP